MNDVINYSQINSRFKKKVIKRYEELKGGIFNPSAYNRWVMWLYFATLKFALATSHIPGTLGKM